ncbi:hypothetical protein PPROV_000092900 [Pycnococcus provasolii]|uniref:Uncharacterized protein n=1 Tax=Pycnococcus provasolii TaxID=41880 RepID=A0A830H6J7_9CHLO|nr:hypothetical protein PPROV_000092900 [Pycnococcus provasolii]|mmetsp:Transcript_13919/g.37007  ORF Transcript_13919/g.37007 Transcript_13919/m.37007 type:complete len:274 (+) Transcript_13919:40-861(+)
MSLASKTVVVTGATDGIGRRTARALARRGANVVIHGRALERVKETVYEVREESKGGDNDIIGVVHDISTTAGVRDLAEVVKTQVGAVDVLINNAGVFLDNKTVTSEGYETTFAVNVLAPYMLTGLLLDNLKEAQEPRVINVSSISQHDGGGVLPLDDLFFEKRAYDRYAAYGLSKLCMASITFSQAEKFEWLTALTCDPGTVNTKMLLAGWGRCGIDVEDADHEEHLATSPDVRSGVYYVRKGQEGNACSICHDAEARTRLWDKCAELTGVTY